MWMLRLQRGHTDTQFLQMVYTGIEICAKASFNYLQEQ